MRIVYLHQYFTTPDMAGGTRSYEMARRLVSWGHEVHMVTSWRESSDRKGWFQTQVDGINVHWLPVPYSNRLSFPQRIKSFIRFAACAAGKAASLEADVVFATSTPLTIALPGVYAARRMQAPMVFEVRDLWPKLPIAIGALRNPLLRNAALWLERFAYANAARVVALSPGMADGVVTGGYPRERIDVIPNSADLALFTPAENDAANFRGAHPELGEGPIVLYPGTLGRINGVGYLARLAAAVREHRPDVRFVVIGDGIEWDHVRAEASRFGVLDVNFFMYPSKPKRELAAAFAAATVVVSLVIPLPELEANSANKFFDGLASGTPVAINYGGWQADLLRQSGAGLVLPPDPEQAASPLLEFLGRPEQVAEAARHARQLAEDRFDRDVLAKQLEQALLSAVAKSGRA